MLGQAPEGEARVNLVLAILRAAQVWGGESGAVPGLRSALGLDEGAEQSGAVDAIEAEARSLVEAMEKAGWQPAAADDLHADPTVVRVLRFAAEQVVPRLDATTDELDAVLHALDGGFIAAGPSGSPLRGLVNVLPTGRNFYTVDPRAVPSRLAYDTGVAMADSLVHRYVDETGDAPALGRALGVGHVGHAHVRRRHRRGAGPDRRPAPLGRGVATRQRPRRRPAATSWADRGSTSPCASRASSATRSRTSSPCSTTPCGWWPSWTSRTSRTSSVPTRRPISPSTATTGAPPPASSAPPGSYGAGILQVVEAGNWRDDQDLAEVYTQWGGFAYGRDLDGAPAADDMRTSYRRIAVAAKNIDTREHDIADSDDYFQYHGGMVATVRALTGSDPKAYVGDSTSPDAVRTRSLSEETARVFRARVVNPRWIGAMQRHGYKGAFELAATVDYLYGFDATAGVVHDWMYESLAKEYVLDEDNQAFMKKSNPWALRGIVERLSEAAERGLWAEPDPEIIAAMQQVYLDVEGDLEDRE